MAVGLEQRRKKNVVSYARSRGSELRRLPFMVRPCSIVQNYRNEGEGYTSGGGDSRYTEGGLDSEVQLLAAVLNDWQK